MGIVHRDLKPDNIMVGRSRDGADVVKVVDFGIAKAADSEGQNVTKTGLIVGTPEYMSPEQIAGDKLDGRSDLYSLALVAFNMLTGKLPFPAASAQESLIMRLTEQPRTLGETRPDVAWPAALQAVMDRALVRDMGHRYAKTTEFARELVRAVEAMPETQVAEGGTLVMSASPAGSPATAVAGAPTSAVPATRIGSLPERPGSHPERSEGPGLGAPDVVALRKPVPKSKTPLIAAMVGSLAVVGAAGYYWVGAGSAASVGDTTQLAGAGAPASVSPAGVPMSQPLSATPALPTSVTMNEVKSLAGSLGTTDTAKTRRILNQLEQLRSVATDSTLDRLDIGIIQAKALLKDVDGACELALRVNTRKLSDVNRERLDVWLGQLNGCK
jgi:serine/threonine-protein kinase